MVVYRAVLRYDSAADDSKFAWDEPIEHSSFGKRGAMEESRFVPRTAAFFIVLLFFLPQGMYSQCELEIRLCVSGPPWHAVSHSGAKRLRLMLPRKFNDFVEFLCFDTNIIVETRVISQADHRRHSRFRIC